MEYTNLGRTALKVSRLCLGTMNFGPHTSEDDAFAVMDRALELGINFFDTANVYGNRIEPGLTESILGRWFAQGGERRERVILGSKVYGDMGAWPNQSRLSALHIRMSCEASLRRLQTDYLDLFQMHHVWREAPWEEVFQALEILVQQGKVLYVGSSNFAAWNVVQANEVAQRRHFLGLVSEQSLYNLLARDIELEMVPACRNYGVGILPWSPLSGGLLAGALEGAEGRRGTPNVTSRIEAQREQLTAWEGLCRELGEEPANVAIAWTLANPAVTAPIVGPRTLQQLDGIQRALEIDLSAEVLGKLDEIFPGPGDQAPEAYAW